MAAPPPNPNASMRRPPVQSIHGKSQKGQGCARNGLFTLILLVTIIEGILFIQSSFTPSNVITLLGLIVALFGVQFFADRLDKVLQFVDDAFGQLGQALSNNRKIMGGMLAALVGLLFIASFCTTPYMFWQVRMPLCDFLLVTQAPTCGNGIGTTTLTVTLPTGISTTTTIGIVDGNVSGMIFNSRVADIEQRIFTANQNIARQSITIVAATTLSDIPNDNNSLSLGYEDLQGIYLFQQAYNTQHQESGKQLRVLIANLGSVSVLNQTSEYVTRQIVLLAQHDPTFAGVVGFPFSGSALSAMNILAYYHIPVISPSASSIALSNQPYFYRIAPSDDRQAQVGANYIASQLHQNVITVFVDSNQSDSYSNSLGKSLLAELQSQGKTVYKETYTANENDSIETALKRTIKNNPRPTLIFFAGLSTDFNQLRADINAFAPNIIAMGGDALYELGGYTDNYKNFYFTAFAYPDTVSAFCSIQTTSPCLQLQQQFTQNFVNTFDPNDKNGANYGKYEIGRVAPHSILSYDAIDALTRAANSQGADINSGTESKEGVNAALSSLAFQGVSGYITFASDNSNPVEKAVLVLCVDNEHRTHLTAIYGTFTPDQSQQPLIVGGACF